MKKGGTMGWDYKSDLKKFMIFFRHAKEIEEFDDLLQTRTKSVVD